MWKFGKEEETKHEVPRAPAAPASAKPLAGTIQHIASPKEAPALETKPLQNYADVAHIGKSVVVKGELSGSEDLYLDGEIEGSISLNEHCLTVGPNGRIHANIHARDIIVHGKVDGNLYGDRVELKKSAVIVGDIFTKRISIEDGAYFKGGVDVQKGEAKPNPSASAPGSPAPAVS
jgi:cytoskeletal protein CcmA (bactofilin family)